jgi:hypothetical protein
MRATVLLALMSTAVACSVGTTTQGYQPATGPAGAAVTLALTGHRAIGGELLAVEHTSLLLVENAQLIRVEVASIRRLKGPKLSVSGPNLSGATREQLRLISRYPQGVSPELEARLLRAYGMSAVRRIS